MLGQLTNSPRRWVLLEKLIVTHLVKKFPIFWETVSLVPVFTRDSFWSLFRAICFPFAGAGICCHSPVSLTLHWTLYRTYAYDRVSLSKWTKQWIIRESDEEKNIEGLVPRRVLCIEDYFSENNRCIFDGWLSCIDLKHAEPLLNEMVSSVIVHETTVTGVQVV
jgi:hypothetical protein